MGFSNIPETVSFGIHGEGTIIEDVWIDDYDTWEPHAQAISFESDKGHVLVLRFCYWKKNEDGSRGAFVPVPMGIWDYVIDDLQKEIHIHKAWMIKNLIRRLIVNDFSSE